MLYKIAVCDDEQIFVDEIIYKLQSRSNKYQIVYFNSGEELTNSVLDFSILFLDIEMPGLSGMETAFKLREMNYDGIIIFLTSHTEFMPEAFKIKDFRFLDKPIDQEKFDEALTSAEKEIMPLIILFFICVIPFTASRESRLSKSRKAFAGLLYRS